MHESARQLDEALIKQVVGLPPLTEPQFFQDIVRLVKELLVKALKISEIMGIETLPPGRFDHRGNPPALLAHGPNVEHAWKE